jgi:hypothetical protein
MRVLIILITLSLSVGCADLSAVRDFAKVSYKIADYTALVDDYVAVPARIKEYAPADRQNFYTEQQKIREGQRPGLLALHARVQDYMEALGQLASDEVVNFDKEFANVEQALTDASFASQPQAQAATQLGQILTKAATDSWRRKKIAALIEQSNEPLQTVLKGMQSFLKGALLQDLEEEQQDIKEFYVGLQKKSSDQAGIQALKEWRDKHEAKLEQSRQSVQTYDKTIKTIQAGHQKLYDERDRLDTKEVMTLITGYVTQLKTLDKTLRSLT